MEIEVTVLWGAVLEPCGCEAKGDFVERGLRAGPTEWWGAFELPGWTRAKAMQYMGIGQLRVWF